jgi:hypothetical protein
VFKSRKIKTSHGEEKVTAEIPHEKTRHEISLLEELKRGRGVLKQQYWAGRPFPLGWLRPRVREIVFI